MKKIFIALLALAGMSLADDSTCQNLCASCVESESGICTQVNKQCSCNEYVEPATTGEEVDEDEADEPQPAPVKTESNSSEAPIIDLGNFDPSSDSGEDAEYSARDKNSKVALTNQNVDLIAGIAFGLSALVALIIALAN